MKQTLIKMFILIFISSLVLSACAAPAAQTAAPAVQTAAPTALAAGSVSITGQGATFPEPIYKEWIYAYTYIDPSVTINYVGTGSGKGKTGIVDGSVDFAGSDSLLSNDDYTKVPDLQMFPTLAGAVVLIYNIEGLKPEDPALVLDRAALTAIYLGDIKKWNDPALAALNPGLVGKLPDKAITTVRRSDGSGTTEIFTKALSAFSDTWKTKVGAAQSVEWPTDKAGTGIGGSGNMGVTQKVQTTPNAIGYVELSYAISNKITFSKIVNKAGKMVDANADSVTAAMSDFSNAFDAKLNATIVDAPGDKSWPIAGYTYMILRMKSMQDCAKASKLVGFIKWALTDPGAAKQAAGLGYLPLPTAVRDTVLQKMATMTCKDQPVK